MIAALSTACGQAVAPPIDGSGDVSASDDASDATSTDPMPLDSSVCPAFDGGFSSGGEACSLVGTWRLYGSLSSPLCYASLAANGTCQLRCETPSLTLECHWSVCGNVMSAAFAGESGLADGCALVQAVQVELSDDCQSVLGVGVSTTCLDFDARGAGILWERVPDRDL